MIRENYRVFSYPGYTETRKTHLVKNSHWYKDPPPHGAPLSKDEHTEGRKMMISRAQDVGVHTHNTQREQGHS